ncbi:hypothetical protein BX616_001816 [Lobosporangium transversale]|nr:hypothetical protein BX616_001816 [Lobosporangium transversale]
MKLRATLQRDLLFFKIAQAVEKIGRSCFIKFTSDYVAFGAIHSLTDNDSTGGGGLIQCWSIESNANNEIYLEMKAEDLLLAMRSSNNATAIVMRMSGRSTDAYLTFSITSEDHHGNSRAITQNVPIINILSMNQVINTPVFNEPMVPAPEVHIMLPQLDRLRHVTASYKNLADHMVISANLQGEMVFTTSDGVQQFYHNSYYKSGRPERGQDQRSGSDLENNDEGGAEEEPVTTRYGMAEKAHVETRFTNLHNPTMLVGDDDHPQLDRQRIRPKEFASVLVRVADMQKVLQSHYVKPSNVICSIVPNHSILFYVYIKDDTQNTTLTYFIPENSL